MRECFSQGGKLVSYCVLLGLGPSLGCNNTSQKLSWWDSSHQKKERKMLEKVKGTGNYVRTWKNLFNIVGYIKISRIILLLYFLLNITKNRKYIFIFYNHINIPYFLYLTFLDFRKFWVQYCRWRDIKR